MRCLIFGTGSEDPAIPGPMCHSGAPDDTLKNHQADLDRAKSFWMLLNPLKCPREVKWIVSDKMDRVQVFQPPKNK